MLGRSGTTAIFRALLFSLAALGCAEPALVVGTWSCPASEREPNDAGMLESVTTPVNVPWSTGFEQGMCDIFIAQGFCYTAGDATYEIVDTPARGKHAIEFSIDTESSDGPQARCVREGELPTDAIYGAWYYVPELHSDTKNWNLFHFQGGEPGGMIHALWDVTLEGTDQETLALYILGSLGSGPEKQPDPPVIVPIGKWFHVELLLRRRSDETGEVALYQDGVRLIRLRGILTDDTPWGQWYVGNLANALTPTASTVYVDDITIRPAP